MCELQYNIQSKVHTFCGKEIMLNSKFSITAQHHSHSDGIQKGQNGEPGIVVQMTTPLTS